MKKKEIRLYDISKSLLLFSHTDSKYLKSYENEVREIYQPKIFLFSPFIPLFVCNGETIGNQGLENIKTFFLNIIIYLYWMFETKVPVRPP